MEPFNILFTSVGRRVSLLRHFRKTLKDLGVPGEIHATDLRKDSPASFVADRHFQTPRVKSRDYIPTLLDICRKNRIKLLIPLIDTELNLLAANEDAFRELGVTPLVSSVKTNRICADKRKTCQFFEKIGVGYPKVFDAEALLTDPDTKFPLLVKPAKGSGGVGVTKVNNFEELKFFKDYIPNAMTQEFLEGAEYTLDVLIDFNGRVRSVVPRLRIEIRAGEVSKGITVKNQRLIEEGKRVAEALPGAVGVVTLQCFITKRKEIKFIEINPRFGGGIPLTLKCGANFPKWIIKMMLGEDPKIAIDGWKEGSVMLRYDDAIFVSRDAIT